CASSLMGMFGVVAVCIYLHAPWARAPMEAGQVWRGNVIWLLCGIGLLVVACFFYTVVTQWTRRLLWIRENVAPKSMGLTVEVIEGSPGAIEFYACLYPLEQSREVEEIGWRVKLWANPPDIMRYTSTKLPAKVQFDPDTATPAVVSFEHGILWSMAGSASVERVRAQSP
ncbi:MAG: hypothetical protein RBS57_15310, partial [Desulforhabdus sp.]|nr:hypothetical protein [Desulforhabdus sp.]